MATERAPLVILGYDSGHLPWLLDWAAAGYLPTLRAILARGCWGRFVGPELVAEHGTALSLWSGVSRARHGYYSFKQLVPGSYNLADYSGQVTGVAPFWSALRGRERRVVVVDPREVSVQRGVC